MLGACGQAAATPIYRLDIDTASLGTGSAFLGLYCLGLRGASDASATVSNLAGALDGAAQLSGAVSGGASAPFVFSNANGGGELVQAIQLGSKFSFEASFAMGSGSTGTTCGWALFDTVQWTGRQIAQELAPGTAIKGEGAVGTCIVWGEKCGGLA